MSPPAPLNESSSIIVPLPLQSLRLSLGRKRNPLCFTQIFSLLLSTAFALVFFCFAYVLSGSRLAFSARIILGPNLMPHTDF